MRLRKRLYSTFIAIYAASRSVSFGLLTAKKAAAMSAAVSAAQTAPAEAGFMRPEAMGRARLTSCSASAGASQISLKIYTAELAAQKSSAAHRQRRTAAPSVSLPLKTSAANTSRCFYFICIYLRKMIFINQSPFSSG